MKSSETVQFKTDSVSLLNLVLKYWKIILATGIAAFIISAVISLTITPLFRSVVVLYPSTNVVETQALFGIQSTSTALFGDEVATEKVLQILQSDIIKNHLVKKYNLIEHYGIGESTKYKFTLLNMRMNKYIVSRKTQYNSVEISVLDTDPLIASAMANDIAGQVDTVFNQIVKDAWGKSYYAINSSYNEQFLRVRSLEDSLRIARPKGNIQVNPGNLTAENKSNSWGIATGLYSPEFLRLLNMFESENENLSAIRNRLTEAKMLSERDIPYTHVIIGAKVSEKKALPKRSLIVIASTLSTLLLLIFMLGIKDSLVRDGE
jgi:uncharacterized protein involved in exopolysaccharide biosynthesis